VNHGPNHTVTSRTGTEGPVLSVAVRFSLGLFPVLVTRPLSTTIICLPNHSLMAVIHHSSMTGILDTKVFYDETFGIWSSTNISTLHYSVPVYKMDVLPLLGSDEYNIFHVMNKFILILQSIYAQVLSITKLSTFKAKVECIKGRMHEDQHNKWRQHLQND
jgi:hypothetical protein